MAKDPDLWKSLTVGDRVRYAAFPTLKGYVHRETHAVYERLVSSGQVLTVEHLEWHDGQSYPWSASFEVDDIEGTHTLMLNDDGLELVE